MVSTVAQSGMVAQWLALLLHSSRDLGPILATVCVEFARSPHVCVGFLPHSKDLWVSWIGYGKLPHVRGISWVNVWGYGIRAWMGLRSVQTRWAVWPPLHYRDSML